MRLDLKALSITTGLIWASAVLTVGLANLTWPSYGIAFLKIISSVYPGFHSNGSFGDVIAGTLYALVDGIIGGLIFAYLYNYLAARKTA